MSPKDALWIINEIRVNRKALNIFERSFLFSVENSIKQPGNSITKKQETVLLNMYSSATGGGLYQQKEIRKKY